jgi:hypothetical protein
MFSTYTKVFVPNTIVDHSPVHSTSGARDAHGTRDTRNMRLDSTHRPQEKYVCRRLFAEGILAYLRNFQSGYGNAGFDGFDGRSRTARYGGVGGRGSR